MIWSLKVMPRWIKCSRSFACHFRSHGSYLMHGLMVVLHWLSAEQYWLNGAPGCGKNGHTQRCIHLQSTPALYSYEYTESTPTACPPPTIKHTLHYTLYTYIHLHTPTTSTFSSTWANNTHEQKWVWIQHTIHTFPISAGLASFQSVQRHQMLSAHWLWQVPTCFDLRPSLSLTKPTRLNLIWWFQSNCITKNKTIQHEKGIKHT